MLFSNQQCLNQHVLTSYGTSLGKGFSTKGTDPLGRALYIYQRNCPTIWQVSFQVIPPNLRPFGNYLSISTGFLVLLLQGERRKNMYEQLLYDMSDQFISVYVFHNLGPTSREAVVVSPFSFLPFIMCWLQNDFVFERNWLFFLRESAAWSGNRHHRHTRYRHAHMQTHTYSQLDQRLCQPL